MLEISPSLLACHAVPAKGWAKEHISGKKLLITDLMASAVRGPAHCRSGSHQLCGSR